ncbi:MAG: hypothetical protein WC683_15055 [bacterium]
MTPTLVEWINRIYLDAMWFVKFRANDLAWAIHDRRNPPIRCPHCGRLIP